MSLCRNGAGGFVRLARARRGAVGQWETAEVKCKSCDVRAGRVECVMKVHEEGVAPPLEPVLDE